MKVLIENRSSQDQERWCRLMLPPSVAARLPGDASEIDGFKFVRGPKINEISQAIYVQTDVPGNTVVTKNLADAVTSTMPPFVLDKSINDNLGKVQFKLRGRHRDGRMVTLPLVYQSVVEDTEACKVFYMKTERVIHGFWGELYAYVYSGQAVVDWSFRWGWCDQSDAEWTARLDYVDLLTGGEEVLIHWSEKIEARKITPSQWRLFDRNTTPLGNTTRMGWFPHGFSQRIYGVLLPELETVGGGVPGPAGLEAARLGEVFAVGDKDVWDGRWFTLGKVPDVDAFNAEDSGRTHTKRFDDVKHTPGNFWEEKEPYGPPWSTGQTGSQGRFGVCKGTRAFYYPGQLELLLYCATDSAQRSYHFREPDNTRVLAANHPELRIIGAWTDPRFSHRDLLGKAGTPAWGWNLSRGGPDGQHRGMNYLWAAAALTGDRLLIDEALDFLEMDLTLLGVPPGGGGVPRSIRTSQDIVKIWWLVPTDGARAQCVSLLNRSLEQWKRNPGRFMSGPVKHFDDINDDRVLRALYTAADPVPPASVGNRVDAWVPWQEALWCGIAIEIRALMQKLGATQRVTDWSGLLSQAASLCLTYGAARDTHSGAMLPLNGVKVLPDGMENPHPPYYELRRPGSSLEDGGLRFPVFDPNGVMIRNGTDVLVGSFGWYWWWSGVIEWAINNLTGEAKTRAEEIRRIMRPTSIDHAEWIAY